MIIPFQRESVPAHDDARRGISISFAIQKAKGNPL
jgi:hypothetical protein